ncbi:hypothetical protein [Microlunatus sp. Gsoil 973]|uniref:hypothetical protein n=1 Tax=Microlunatus sp. Gsoil 973 TaxID=2672569 RepID=UPI0012B4F7D7|nr:hypothetical protein [Microlunatus sp. Gsoil 973]QGN33946.1 hypothetical protein GJV80_15240 [Microlunatus sp. Gsoil 973]
MIKIKWRVVAEAWEGAHRSVVLGEVGRLHERFSTQEGVPRGQLRSSPHGTPRPGLPSTTRPKLRATPERRRIANHARCGRHTKKV